MAFSCLNKAGVEAQLDKATMCQSRLSRTSSEGVSAQLFLGRNIHVTAAYRRLCQPLSLDKRFIGSNIGCKALKLEKKKCNSEDGGCRPSYELRLVVDLVATGGRIVDLSFLILHRFAIEATIQRRTWVVSVSLEPMPSYFLSTLKPWRLSCWIAQVGRQTEYDQRGQWI